MKPVTFENRVNQERVICENVTQIQTIDGVEYLPVHKQDNQRTFLMRKDILAKISEKPKK